MSFDIRGAWKYRDLLEEYSELQVRASKRYFRSRRSATTLKK